MWKIKNQEILWGISLFILAVVVIYYYGFAAVYTDLHNRRSAVFPWMVDSWKPRNDLVHGYAIPFLFIAFIVIAWKGMRKDSKSPSWWGVVPLVFGLLLYVASVRVIQPRLAIIGLPFLIVGSVQFVCGAAIAKRMLFPSFFWYFAIPVPGIRQATNFLQVWVTEACYEVGSYFGMKLINAGNEIRSATDSWDALSIAEGCSGIRSLMALVMISAMYAYYTQKKPWKMAVLFACSLPLALIANFFRIFTIIVLAEMGHSEFASGIYHDWAGLLFFFPIALAGLFLVDKLLNWRGNRKVVRKRLQ